MTRHAHGFGLGLTLGSPVKFIGVSLGTTHFDDLNGSSLDLAAGGGYELALDQRGRVQLCPAVTVGHRAGPHTTLYGDYFETDVAVSLELGDVVVKSRHGLLIPSIGFGVEYAQQGFTSAGPLAPATSHTFALLSLGVGAVFGNRVTVLPGADIPVGLSHASVSFGLTLAANIGH